MASAHKKLKSALASGCEAEVADALLNVMGPNADSVQLATCLRSAAARLEEKHATTAQYQSDLKNGVPPGKPAVFNGIHFDSGCMTELQRAMIQHLNTQSKGRLACVSTYWREAINHPAFWPVLCPPSAVLSTVKDFVAWLRRRSETFCGAKCFAWQMGVVSPGSGAITNALKICPNITEVDLRGYRPKDCYHLNTHFLPLIYHLSSTRIQKLIFWNESYRSNFDLGLLTDFLVDSQKNKVPLSPGSLMIETDIHGVVTDIHLERMYANPPSYTWKFEELREIEMHFLPPGRVRKRLAADWHFRHASVTDIVTSIVRCSSKLETFTIRDAQNKDHVLNIDVEGVRNGHREATYPSEEYVDYLVDHSMRPIGSAGENGQT